MACSRLNIKCLHHYSLPNTLRFHSYLHLNEEFASCLDFLCDSVWYLSDCLSSCALEDNEFLFVSLRSTPPLTLLGIPFDIDIEGWRHGSTLKSSCRGPGFNSQPLHGDSLRSVVSNPSFKFRRPNASF